VIELGLSRRGRHRIEETGPSPKYKEAIRNEEYQSLQEEYKPQVSSFTCGAEDWLYSIKVLG
jgi:hypothetical protein